LDSVFSKSAKLIAFRSIRITRETGTQDNMTYALFFGGVFRGYIKLLGFVAPSLVLDLLEGPAKASLLAVDCLSGDSEEFRT